MTWPPFRWSGARLTPMRIAMLVAMVMSSTRIGGCHYLSLLDLRAMDFRLLQRGEEPGSPDVVVVAVDDASIEALGRWPWSPTRMAQLIDRIAAGEPAAIGFDIVWSEHSTPAEEADLVRAIAASQRAALGYFFDFETTVETGAPIDIPTEHILRGRGRGLEHVPEAKKVTVNLDAITQAGKETGYFNFIPDDDGYFRRGALAIRYAEQAAVPLSLAMLRVAEPKKPLQLNWDDGGAVDVYWGDTVAPVAEDAQLLINYRGGRRAFRQVPAHDLLAARIAPAELRGKLVLVGVTAIGVSDVRNTAFDPQLPGVLIHANVIDNVLRNEFLWQPRLILLLELPAIAVLVLTLGYAMHRARGISAALAMVALVAFYFVSSQWLFLTHGIVLSVVFPVLGIVLTYFSISLHQFLVVEQQRRLLRRMLELYTSPAIARILSEQPELLHQDAEKVDLTILFSDIRDFTTVCEGMGPAVVPLLNSYLGEMTEVIYSYDGTVRYVGDAIMTFWNKPVGQADHVERGCRVALGMVARLRELESEWKDRGWPVLRIGIGLNTGPMVFGSLGSTNHLSFEVVGDHANLGARLEGLTKIYGCTIIASEAVVRGAPDLITVRELDYVRVKGKEIPVRIYEVLGPADERERWAPVIEAFESALAAYRAQRWSDARAGFERLLAMRPDDGPATLFRSRCDAMTNVTLPADWDGVTVMETK